ncbi:MAG TPA: hypothetical protein VNH40_03050, partial [Gaiellaceae bacterium]|nr:hypothetical protein [Gaiellaceae bacterium]
RELADAPLDRARLADRAGRMARQAGRPEDARTRFDDAHATFERAGDSRAAALVAAALAEIDFIDGHPQQAVARLEPALEALRDQGTDAEVAVLSAELGRFLFFSDEVELAAPHLETALALSEALDLPETLAEALNSKSLLLSRADRLYEARVLLEGALSLALARDLHRAALRAYNNLVVIELQLDAFDEVRQLNQLGLELARRVGDRDWESNYVAGSVGLLFWAGRWDEALVRLEAARELATTAFAQGLTLSVVPLYCHRGRPDEARRVLAEQQESSADSDNSEFSISYRVTEALVLRAEGRLEESLAAAEEALEAARRLSATTWTTKGALLRALEAASAAGDLGAVRRLLTTLDGYRPGELTPFVRALQERFGALFAGSEAERHYANAERLLDEMGLVFELAVTKLEHGEWLVAQDRGEEAAEVLRDARALFERMQAIPWLERAAALESRLPAALTA